MRAPTQAFWIAVSAVVVGVLLFIWISAGLLAVIVMAAATDLALSAADRRARPSDTRAKVSDR